jgi:hypothetical protein
MQSIGTNEKDYLNSLPVDTIAPTPREQKMVDTLFTKHSNTMDSMYSESKDSILVGILFIMFSLPQVNTIIYKFVPSAETSMYITIAIKAIAVMALYWIIKHFYLSRK